MLLAYLQTLSYYSSVKMQATHDFYRNSDSALVFHELFDSFSLNSGKKGSQIAIKTPIQLPFLFSSVISTSSISQVHSPAALSSVALHLSVDTQALILPT